MIRTSDLVLEYPSRANRGQRALDGIDLTVREGEAVGLIGANGCGKTTLARCLSALLTPTRGDVWVDELNTKDEGHRYEIHRRVGLVFQNPENQIVSVTVEREIAFGLENMGVPYEEMHRIVDDMLQRFDLVRYRHHPPHRLSGGEMQRLAVAAVMAMAPKYLIFDEPTSLLDPSGRRMVRSLIRDLLSENQCKPPAERVSVVFITQYPEEVLDFERLLVMHRGRFVMDGSPLEIFQRVEELQEIGLSVPVEFEVDHYLKRLTHGKISLNPSDYLSIP